MNADQTAYQQIPLLQCVPVEVQLIAAIETVVEVVAPEIEDNGDNWKLRHEREMIMQRVAAYIHEKYGYKPERAT